MSAETQHAQDHKGKVQVGDHAPAFSLPTQSGATLSLSDFLGKTVVLYFYPKDN